MDRLMNGINPFLTGCYPSCCSGQRVRLNSVHWFMEYSGKIVKVGEGVCLHTVAIQKFLFEDVKIK